MISEKKLVRSFTTVDKAGKQYTIYMFIDERPHKKTPNLAWYEDHDGLLVNPTDEQAGIFEIIGIGTVRRIDAVSVNPLINDSPHPG
jgi:hypothetical protein